MNMSLVVQSLVSANTTATSGSSSTSTGTTAAVPFAQTLVQTMGGNTANTTSVPTDPILGNLASLLQGLLKEVQTTGDEQGDKTHSIQISLRNSLLILKIWMKASIMILLCW